MQERPKWHRRGKLQNGLFVVKLSGKRTVSGHISEKLKYLAPKEQDPFFVGWNLSGF